MYDFYVNINLFIYLKLYRSIIVDNKVDKLDTKPDAILSHVNDVGARFFLSAEKLPTLISKP